MMTGSRFFQWKINNKISLHEDEVKNFEDFYKINLIVTE